MYYTIRLHAAAKRGGMAAWNSRLDTYNARSADDDELNTNPPTPFQQQAPVQTKTQEQWPANQDPRVPGQRANGGGC